MWKFCKLYQKIIFHLKIRNCVNLDKTFYPSFDFRRIKTVNSVSSKWTVCSSIESPWSPVMPRISSFIESPWSPVMPRIMYGVRQKQKNVRLQSSLVHKFHKWRVNLEVHLKLKSTWNATTHWFPKGSSFIPS